ncbi:MAG TPA: hypothetical protein VI197_24670 [Polyangiaceae bacterium]
MLTLTANAVAAEPTAADRATARSLAREGFEALKTDDFVTAEDRFRRADALVHAPTLVVDHARALVGLGRLVEAHERYSLVLREGVSPNAAWPWKRAYADAQKEIEVIKQRLAWLTIEISGPTAPTEPQVTVDGKPIPAAAVGVRRATDPGERTIKAAANGFYPKEETVILGEGAEQTVRFELEAMPPEAIAAEAPPEAAPAERASAAATPAEAPTDDTLAYVALGVGGAGLVAWGVSGVFFLKEHSTLKKECANDECLPDQQEHKDRYETLGWISGASLAVGVAGVAAGVSLLLLNEPSTNQAQAPAVRVAPYFAGDSVGLTGQF